MKQQWQHPHPATAPHSWRTPLVVYCFAGILVLSGRSEGGESAAHQPKTPVNTDSLRLAIDQLKKDAAALRLKAEAISDSIEDPENNKNDLPAAPALPPKDSAVAEQSRATPKDTVELLSKEGTHAFLESFRGKKRGSRERGYGGGLGATPGMFMVNMRPVRELLDIITSTSEYKNISFPIGGSYQGFFMMGITGYGALGNGLRVGGHYQGGSRSYSTRKNDTTYTVDVRTSFGGFLLEKAAVSGNTNWYVGGMAGGATIEVNPSKASNLFSQVSIGDAIKDEFNKLNAPALLLELHGGFTYTMVNWFHIGADLSTPLYFSPSGFKTPASQSVTNGFLSVNPGFRIRIILGNIG